MAVVVKTTLFITYLAVLAWKSQADCIGNNECPESKVCCKNEECRESCVGYDCNADSDCGGDNEYCCSNTCRNGNCGLSAWMIVLIVLSVLGVVTTIVIVLCYYCSHRYVIRSPGLLVSAADVPPVTLTVTYGAVYIHSRAS